MPRYTLELIAGLLLTSQVVFAQTRPDAPSDLLAEPGNGQITLHWTLGGDGGSAITKHQYKSGFGTTEWTDIPNSGADGANATSYTITGLTNGTSYYVFAVRAVNAEGTGAASDEVSMAPMPTSASWATDNQVRLVYVTQQDSIAIYGDGDCRTYDDSDPQAQGTSTTCPAQLEGWVEIAHSVKSTRAFGGVCDDRWDEVGAEMACRSMSLSEGRAGSSTDAAQGEATFLWLDDVQCAGTEEGLHECPAIKWANHNCAVSETAAAACHYTPAAIDDLSAVAADGEVTLSWSLPDAGAGSLTGHHYYQCSGAGCTPTDSAKTDIASSASLTSHTVTGLTNDTVYRFQVGADNNASGFTRTSDAPPSNIVEATPWVPGPPDAPADLLTEPGNTQVTLHWTLGGDGGSAITKHQYKLDAADWADIPNSGADGTNATSHTVTGLTNGTVYEFNVRAVNAQGTGAASDEVSIMAPMPTSASWATDNQVRLVYVTQQDSIAIYGDGDCRTYDDADPQAQGTSTTCPAQLEGWVEIAHSVKTTRAFGGVCDDYWDEVGAEMACRSMSLSEGRAGSEGTADLGEATFLWLDDVQCAGTEAGLHECPATKWANHNCGTNETAAAACHYTPAAIDDLSAVAADGEVTLSWSLPDAGAGSLTGHHYYQCSGAGCTPTDSAKTDIASSASLTSHTVTGLTNDTLYRFQMAADNDASGFDRLAATPLSNIVEATPAVIPDTAPEFDQTTADKSYVVGTAVSETLPTATGGNGILVYTLTPGLPGGLSFDANARGVSGVPTISQVATDHTYTVADSDNNSDSTDTHTQNFTIEVAPRKAQALTGAPGDAEVRLVWAWDTADTGITGWQLSQDQGATWSDITPDNSWQTETSVEKTVTGLTNGTEYTFSVRAVSADTGTPTLRILGESSDELRSTPTTSPDAPTNLSLAVGDSKIRATWAAPADDGGSPVTGYRVQWTLASDTSFDSPLGEADVSGTIHSITNLTNDTRYAVRVRAVNAAGDGEWSNAASAKLVTIPDAPAAPTLTAGNAQISATWAAPAGDAVPIRSYRIQWTLATDAGFRNPLGATDVSSTTYSITNLTNGTEYAMRVRAVSDAGEGPWSIASTATPITVPGAPGAPSLVPGNGEISSTWIAPDNDGGSAVTGYHVQWTLATDTDFSRLLGWKDITGETLNLTDLVNGVAYAVRVRALSAFGNGAWSPVANATPATVSGAPSAPALIPGDGEISATWSSPANDGGRPVSGYRIQWTLATDAEFDSPLGSVDLADNAYRMTNLENGTGYAVRVRAVNAVGNGNWSPEATTTPATIPNDLVAPTLEPGDRSIAASWRTAFGDGGRPVTGYRVQWALATVSGFDSPLGTMEVAGTTFSIANLTNGTGYAVRVRAINAVGESDWSPATTAMPATVPDAPQAPTLVPGDGEILAIWSAPTDDGGSAVTGYRVQWALATDNEFGNPLGDREVTGTAFSITNLANGTRYAVRVRAINAVGDGDWSTATIAKLNSEPVIAGANPLPLDIAENTTGAVHSFSASDVDGDILQWSLPEDSATIFVIDADTGALSVIASANIDYESSTLNHDLSVTVDDGKGGTDTVAVMVRITDVSEPPLAPALPEVTAVSASSLSVTWSAPDNVGRPEVDGYNLRYCPGSTGCDASSDWTEWAPVIHDTATQTNLDDLDPDTAYELQVRAVNDEGKGDWSASGLGRTLVPVLLLSEQSVSVAEDGVGNNAQYGVALSNRPSATVMVKLSSDDSSVATVSPSALAFTRTNWNSSQTVTVTGVNDSVDNDGRATLIRHQASGGGYDQSGELVLEVTLVDDDTASVSITSLSAPEGDSGVSQWSFAVNLSIASASEVRVQWATLDDTATAGEDYAAAAGTLRFSPGVTSSTIAVPVFGDELAEMDEYFHVVLTTAIGAELGDASVRGTILDDDLESARGGALEGMLAGLARTLGADAVSAVTQRLQGSFTGGGCGREDEAPSRSRFDLSPGVLDDASPITGTYPSAISARAVKGLKSPVRGIGGFETGSGMNADQSRVGSRNSGSDVGSTLWSLLPRQFETRLGSSTDVDGECAVGLGLWGRITTSRFDAAANGQDFDGDLHTAYLGMDRRFGGLLAGVALTHSLGDLGSGASPISGLSAQADTSLTSVLPYGRLDLVSGSLWGLLGIGRGEVDLSDEFGEVGTNLSMHLAAAGWRREIGLARRGGLRLAVKADAFGSWLSADGVTHLLPETDAEASRVRLLLEAGMQLPSYGDGYTSVQIDAGGRWDGGTANGGSGVELDLSLSHRQPEMGLEISADGRYTLLHGADRFADSSLSLTVSIDPGAPGSGLRLSFSPAWGAVGGGAMSWLQADAGGTMMPGMSGGATMFTVSRDSSQFGWNPASYQAEIGYGWVGRLGRPLNLYSAMEKLRSGAVMRIGGQMTLSERLGLGLELNRSEQGAGPPEHAIMLRLGSSMEGAMKK